MKGKRRRADLIFRAAARSAAFCNYDLGVVLGRAVKTQQPENDKHANDEKLSTNYKVVLFFSHLGGYSSQKLIFFQLKHQETSFRDLDVCLVKLIQHTGTDLL